MPEPRDPNTDPEQERQFRPDREPTIPQRGDEERISDDDDELLDDDDLNEE